MEAIGGIMVKIVGRSAGTGRVGPGKLGITGTAHWQEPGAWPETIRIIMIGVIFY